MYYRPFLLPGVLDSGCFYLCVMYTGLESPAKPDFIVVRARSHIITKPRSHLVYSNHVLSHLYQTLSDEHGHPDCAINIAVVGNRGIGKTSLIYRIFNNSPPYNGYIPTTGIHKLYMYRGFTDPDILPGSTSRPLQMQLSLRDFGFHDHTVSPIQALSKYSSYYDGIHAFLLCYAIDDRDSFLSVTGWIKHLYQMTEGRRVAIVLVGLRTDADRPYLTDAQKKMQRYQGWRVVPAREAIQFSWFHRIPYIECTASMGWFCDDVLATAVHHALRLNCTIQNPLHLPKLFFPEHIAASAVCKDEPAVSASEAGATAGPNNSSAVHGSRDNNNNNSNVTDNSTNNSNSNSNSISNRSSDRNGIANGTDTAGASSSCCTLG